MSSDRTLQNTEYVDSAPSAAGAWSLEIRADCQVSCREGISLNLFEFLGGIISVWVEILAGRVPPGSCLLAQGDSTLVTGWLKKSNFQGTNHPMQLEAARHLAFLLLDALVIFYSQWFARKDNGRSNVLSRDTHLTATALTDLLHSSIPEQVPPNFSICPLPPAICSWLISLLRSQPLIKVSKKEPTRSTIWLGRGGQCGCSPSSSSTTSTCLAAFEPRTRLLGAFASAVRTARFSGPAYCQLAAGTVSDSVNHVAASFVEAGFPDPRQSEAGAPSRFLLRQYKSYRNLDKNLKQQKAITASVLLNMHAHAQLPFSTPAEKATSDLAIGPSFSP
jgi:hypothetical protein